MVTTLQKCSSAAPVIGRQKQHYKHHVLKAEGRLVTILYKETDHTIIIQHNKLSNHGTITNSIGNLFIHFGGIKRWQLPFKLNIKTP